MGLFWQVVVEAAAIAPLQMVEDDEPQDLSGNQLTQAPKNKIFLNASYSVRTASQGEFVPSVSYSWVDKRQYDLFDTDATLADAYYRLDVR